MYLVIDPWLIWFYRITGYAFVDFLLGTFVLAWIALLLGEMTISVSFLLVRRKIELVNQQMGKYQTMSMEALQAGDQQAYKAANKLANDAFGRSFFMQIALSAAFLWPIFFALEWMSLRFSDVEFEMLFSNRSMGFTGVFIVMYALAYIIFKRIKYRLPYFRRIKAILDSYKEYDFRQEAENSISRAP
uniref:DUF106 domain-containing protein n=1 Tax=Desulfomonile tiedjei TaxID=2358 RepID=A0A7C4AR55_9BACT